MLTTNIKIALALFMISVASYTWYKLVEEPRDKIEELNQELSKKEKLPVEVVSRINKADANRTQKEINNVRIIEANISSDSGRLIFE
jgi:hypothetical protein